jgi:hypothetical protein
MEKEEKKGPVPSNQAQPSFSPGPLDGSFPRVAVRRPTHLAPTQARPSPNPGRVGIPAAAAPTAPCPPVSATTAHCSSPLNHPLRRVCPLREDSGNRRPGLPHSSTQRHALLPLQTARDQAASPPPPSTPSPSSPRRVSATISRLSSSCWSSSG